MIRRMKKPIPTAKTTSAKKSLTDKSAPGLDKLTTLMYEKIEKTWAPMLKKLSNDVERGIHSTDSFRLATIEVSSKQTKTLRVTDEKPVNVINKNQ